MDSISENISVPLMDDYHEDAFISAMQISSKLVLPLVLKAALDLNLLELIKKAGASASASASELAAQLPTTNPKAASLTDRILSLLAAQSVLFSSLKKLPNGAGVERRYSLAPVCKYLSTTGNDRDGGCAGPFPLRISEEEHDQDAYLFAMQLASDSVLPMVLKTAIELGLFEEMKRAGPGASASAFELAAQLSTNNPDSANMIERILRLLAEHSVVIRSLETLPDGIVESRYSLAPACMYLIREDEGSVAPMHAAIQEKVFLESWYHLKDAVLEGGIPFEKAAGTTIFEYTSKNPRVNYLFNRCMSEHTGVFMKKLLQKYKGFEGLRSLVDVGGGIGSTLSLIVSKYPTIKGINFDLPHVIQNAVSYPGVEHVAGDMFVSIPTADAIFMKLICHDWSDAHCQKILKKCYEALPDNGKVIIADQILAKDPNSGRALLGESRGDLNMLVYGLGGKERTEKEFQILAKQAGFREFHKVCCAFGLWIMDLYK